MNNCDADIKEDMFALMDRGESTSLLAEVTGTGTKLVECKRDVLMARGNAPYPRMRGWRYPGDEPWRMI